MQAFLHVGGTPDRIQDVVDPGPFHETVVDADLADALAAGGHREVLHRIFLRHRVLVVVAERAEEVLQRLLDDLVPREIEFPGAHAEVFLAHLEELVPFV
ncbi:hypothetical protein GCM10009850_044550 [Nonomuraea monospora]|uniref:Uncharacterized protein n=1 Tax=Nonomuraea monospora TaxID=568818 RepID=A0ABN3CI98_9ACTN